MPVAFLQFTNQLKKWHGIGNVLCEAKKIDNNKTSSCENLY